MFGIYPCVGPKYRPMSLSVCLRVPQSFVSCRRLCVKDSVFVCSPKRRKNNKQSMPEFYAGLWAPSQGERSIYCIFYIVRNAGQETRSTHASIINHFFNTYEYEFRTNEPSAKPRRAVQGVWILSVHSCLQLFCGFVCSQWKIVMLDVHIGNGMYYMVVLNRQNLLLWNTCSCKCGRIQNILSI